MFGSGSLRLSASLILALGLSVGCGGDEGIDRPETGGSGGSGGSTGGSGGSTGGSGGSTGGTGGSTGGTGGTTGGSGGSTGGTGGGGGCQKGATKPTQVVWIGDSYPDSGNGGIQRYTEQSAQAAGALAAGATYRRYYAGGTQMANGQIPGQYTTAKTADANITTVIMTGGGNDILIGNSTCLLNPPPANQSCVDTVNRAVTATETLLAQMQTDGVKNVVYYFYPRTTFAMSGANVDYAFPFVKAACDKFQGPLTCTFIDSRPAFVGQMFFMGDGIHPNDAGQKAIGGLVWDTMLSKCIAQ